MSTVLAFEVADFGFEIRPGQKFGLKILLPKERRFKIHTYFEDFVLMRILVIPGLTKKVTSGFNDEYYELSINN